MTTAQLLKEIERRGKKWGPIGLNFKNFIQETVNRRCATFSEPYKQVFLAVKKC
jgi:hypothetical protein